MITNALIILGACYGFVVLILAAIMAVTVIAHGGFENMTKEMNAELGDNITSIGFQWFLVWFVLMWPWAFYEAIIATRSLD